jgi:hypothetical protein
MEDLKGFLKAPAGSIRLGLCARGWVLLPTVVTVFLAACSGKIAAGAGAAPTASTLLCSAADLRLSLSPLGQGAGNHYYLGTITNDSSSACSVAEGTPSFEHEGAAGQPVTSFTVAPLPSPSSAPLPTNGVLSIVPGHKLYFIVNELSETCAFVPATPSPAAVTDVVTLPGQTSLKLSTPASGIEYICAKEEAEIGALQSTDPSGAYSAPAPSTSLGP